jgi:RNA polymerase sigma factor (sigma-70 family)
VHIGRPVQPHTPALVDAGVSAASAAATPDFDAVVAAHGAAIARVAGAFEHNPARRDELVQEILLAIWQALPRFRGDAGIRTFVLRIAHHHAVDHVARETRDRARDPLDDTLPDAAADPERRAGLQAQAERLLAAVRRLPLGQRELVTLALEGLAHQEIADVLGISVGNVAVRLSRARSTLKQQLEEGR